MSDSTVPVAPPGQGAGPRSDRAHRAGEVADGLIRDFHPVTALDVGGAGDLIEALRGRGVDASGIETSKPIEGRYDLVICIDVLEDLSAKAADTTIANLCAAADRMVVSVAQTPQDWAAKLAEHGFVRDLDRDLSYISPWAAAFVRGDESQVETVRRYDRAWYRLQQEVAEVRRSLQEHRQRLTEMEGETEADSRSELAEKLRQSEAEVLRLRDLLIGKEAELGVAVGRVAELELRIDWRTVLKHRWHQIRGALAQVPGLKRLKRLTRPR
jgi:hypothetical protein